MTAHTVVAEGEGRFAAQEHRDLAHGLAHIGETVERSTELPSDQLWARLHHALGWLERDLRPHLVWEDTWLYPQLDQLAGTPWATKMARFEHRQIETLIAALESDSARWLDHATARTNADLVAHLSAIRAVITMHLEAEERLLLPLLEERDGAPG
jgi:iron-sulfur cluster repair protein YtfE (RIC family)